MGKPQYLYVYIGTEKEGINEIVKLTLKEVIRVTPIQKDIVVGTSIISTDFQYNSFNVHIKYTHHSKFVILLAKLFHFNFPLSNKPYKVNSTVSSEKDPTL